MSHITIAGLGPGAPDLRTVETAQAISDASSIVLRTSIHPGIEDLSGDSRVVACDDIYESGHSFDAVYTEIAERIVTLADHGDLLYLTPGHPLYGERVTPLITEMARERGHSWSILTAVSAFDSIATSLQIDLMDAEPQSIDATTLALALDQEPFAAGIVDLSPTRPILVTQLFNRDMASATKLILGRIYPESHEVAVVRSAGLPEQTIDRIPLHRLDHVDADHLTSVWVPALDSLASTQTFSSLLRIAARLRAPGGCPWDREQTAESLLPSLLEEAYEVVDAIQSGDMEHASEELGDLLLHVVMQSQIAEEEGFFGINDVAQQITTKLIRRHPHVFGDVSAENSDDVLGVWQRVKAAERADGGKQPPPEHPIDRYPRSMPVARRLHDLNGGKSEPKTEVPESEIGDRLFAATQAAIDAGFDPERLLLDAARRGIPATK
jgi:tetrapyrrole methylase family protein/MazG family protein